jgi:hypothetical protein
MIELSQGHIYRNITVGVVDSWIVDMIASEYLQGHIYVRMITILTGIGE